MLEGDIITDERTFFCDLLFESVVLIEERDKIDMFVHSERDLTKT